MIKYLLCRSSARASKVAEYYPLCTTDIDNSSLTPILELDSLQEGLDELDRPYMYFPELDNDGYYTEYFVQAEEYDENGEFFQVVDYYGWNHSNKYVWRERNKGIEVFEFELVRGYMDDEIVEEMDRKYLFDNDQKFFLKYCELHEQKYGEDIEV